jgi:hypothetical protein
MEDDATGLILPRTVQRELRDDGMPAKAVLNVRRGRGGRS